MTSESDDAVSVLRSADTIRSRCQAVLQAGRDAQLEHFSVHPERLGAAAALTWSVTQESYPSAAVPIHGRVNHFAVGGVDRVGELSSGVRDRVERARLLTGLVVTSVLLDAGAGPDWRYREPATSLEMGRSEGLALASFHAFVSGRFSSNAQRPLQADAEGLCRLEEGQLAEAFQVRVGNPLLGVAGRVRLLQRLGGLVSRTPQAFGGSGRVGGLCDVLVARAESGRLPAREVLATVLEVLSPIWPPRTQLQGRELGDVWPHPRAGGSGLSSGLVPLHKLSLWLSYSLVAPLRMAGLTVTDLDQLPGLSEYRNGGLLIDTGVLVEKYPGVTREPHPPDAEVVVEWRALTVALLDELAIEVRRHAGLDESSLPLGAVLEGGTWAAGRKLARERRGGRPPITVQSDGTLF